MTGRKKKGGGASILPNTPTSTLGTESITDSLAHLNIGSSASSSSTQGVNLNANQTDMKGETTKKKQKKPKRDIVKDWSEYIGDESKLENWARFCRDLGLVGEFTSINKCRIALEPIWVNIRDFLDERQGKGKAKRFQSEGALAKYTIKTRKFYPREKAKEGGPLRALLAHIFSHRGHK
ncbi:uncharacterized protein PAC_00148 [Phialocephala subalpina]|uniref:Uncharacterized protein n=1 Tax=Phialocephala subalpina TaxID=576137 RepID=A0A1L7WBW7_9HELO|nr:uncharacterized protein PAC_00148 [Phialocephala subalpina]